MKVKIKKLHPDAVIPSYGKPGDAGMDLTAVSIEAVIPGNVTYGTGIAVEIPEGYVGLIFPRSSVCKTDLSLTNAVGVIDSGYRGEIKLVFGHYRETEISHHTIGKDFRTGVPVYKPKLYQVGERIGQLIIMPYPQIEFEEADELSSTERGEGGYGSTGR